jgi:hypothetical protein
VSGLPAIAVFERLLSVGQRGRGAVELSSELGAIGSDNTNAGRLGVVVWHQASLGVRTGRIVAELRVIRSQATTAPIENVKIEGERDAYRPLQGISA